MIPTDEIAIPPTVETPSGRAWLADLDAILKNSVEGNPEYPREPAIRGEAPHVLSPLNFAAQFIAENDDAAAARIRDAVQRICDGTLSPDDDFRWQWIELFGGNMVKGYVAA